MTKRRPNPFFEFQQFTVFHDQCAMKVGTDGVLLGAWANVENAHTALDIGTGTGLIALMLAQRSQALSIDAIDVDEGAMRQATNNVANSPFEDRIKVMQCSIQAYKPTKTYDLIVSNPPFFAEIIKSPDTQRSTARNNESLPIEKLFTLATKLINNDACISIIYPFSNKALLTTIANENQLHIARITNVLPTPQSAPKRILMELSKQKRELKENDLIVEMERHVYSEEFKKLVKGFYLEL